MQISSCTHLLLLNFLVACFLSDNVAAIINSCGEFSHKGAFCNRMGGPAGRPTERAGERTAAAAAAAAYQMQSNRLRNSHARRRRQRNIFVGAQITLRTLRARLASLGRSQSLWVAERTTRVETGRISERKTILLLYLIDLNYLIQ